MDDQPMRPGAEGDQPPELPSPTRESAASAGERIQVIIEAAEKAAAGIIEDADAQARRYIEASHRRADVLADERVRAMSDLTDTLIRQAELVRRQSDELLAALDAARSELAGRIGQELSVGGTAPANEQAAMRMDQPVPPAPGPRVPHLQPVDTGRPDLHEVQPQAESEPRREPQPPPSSGAPGATQLNEARLLAAQMAVAGSSREEIEGRLSDDFGIQDAGPVLDGILGPG
jgi:hypothetical protein